MSCINGCRGTFGADGLIPVPHIREQYLVSQCIWVSYGSAVGNSCFSGETISYFTDINVTSLCQIVGACKG